MGSTDVPDSYAAEVCVDLPTLERALAEHRTTGSTTSKVLVHINGRPLDATLDPVALSTYNATTYLLLSICQPHNLCQGRCYIVLSRPSVADDWSEGQFYLIEPDTARQAAIPAQVPRKPQ